MESALNNGMCRCCASEGTFKDVKSTYHWMGDTEVYSDMLRECFDIDLYLTEDGDDGGICEVCITQLRNASNFKKQVQYTELQFKKRLEEPMFKSDIIKIEPSKEDELESDNDDHNASHMSDASTEFGVPIKMEELEEIKPKKRAAKASTSRAKKSKVEAGESSSKRVVPAVELIRDYSTNPPPLIFKEVIVIKEESESDIGQTEQTQEKTHKKVTIKKVPILRAKRKQYEGGLDSTKPRVSPRNLVLTKHRDNVRVILECSNATLFNGHSDLGYVCYYCVKKYPDPAELKQHTLTTHSDIKKAKFMQEVTEHMKFLLKLDITGLSCKICSAEIENLEDLKDHLSKDHGKIIHRDVKNQILPFKLKKQQMECFMCSTPFLKFRVLFSHMKTHYPNYVCSECNNGYVTQNSLNVHMKRHQTGTFKCGHCDKVFSSEVKQKFHVSAVHRGTSVSGSRCGHCGKIFRSSSQKTKHLVDVHKVAVPEYVCQTCGRSFIRPSSLSKHIRRDHLNERNHKCTECDMAFYALPELKMHMVKHTGERNFHCEVCSKAYTRKKTLREHMKIHTDGRRLK